MLEAQGILRKGIRWKIGEGDQVRVWGHPWLHDNDDPYIETPCVEGFEDFLVKDLMKPGTKMWDREFIMQIFTERDVKRILKTPISPRGHGDRIIWSRTKNGVYTVKSGYRLAVDLVEDSRVHEDVNWNSLWRFRLPPKIKDFIWRVCSNVLPNKSNLAKKQVVSDSLCVLCGEGGETSWHNFFECYFALSCWNESGLRNIIENTIPHVDDLKGLIFKLLQDLEVTKAKEFCSILWRIWRERNLCLWEGKHSSPPFAVNAARTVFRDWELANLRPRVTTRLPKCSAWHKPPTGFLKVNVDASFNLEANETGVGMVFCDDRGEFVAARVMNYPGCMEVATGEAMGFLEALSWIKDLELSKVIVEGDAKVVVDAIKANTTGISSYFDIISNCTRIISSLQDVSVNFVKRSANCLAHAFASEALNYESLSTWVDPPSFVVGLPAEACSCG